MVRYFITGQLNHLNTRQMDTGLEFKWFIEEQVNLPFEIQPLIFFKFDLNVFGIQIPTVFVFAESALIWKLKLQFS